MPDALINAQFFTGTEMIRDKVLLVENGRITGFIIADAIPAGATVIDCRGYLVTAGLIDLQIAGGGGFLFSANPTREALEAMTEAILRSGTTGFLIALPTNSYDVYAAAFRVIKENHHPAILGLHLEGPFISLARRGAHTRELIRKPSAGELHELLREAEGVVKMMTVAPEVCTPEIITILRDHGVTVAAGHSNANFTEALKGFEWGIETTTHLFNAMSPIHHRDPGLPGAVFSSEKACASIIADGIHVDFNMLTISKKIMKERLFLVSDAVEENDRGAYQHVRQHDRFTLPDGTMSGSNLTMLSAVKNCIDYAGIMVEEALRMASLYPSSLIRVSDRGKISPGCRADLIALDNSLRLKGLYNNGKMNYID
ncbi:MAG: N-acetylglucosamine-6-phosphate deacetylase [Bacteroidales bacterium]|jgi:N-acetylglucosamine-6-phosphate deacetylase|nr:N-acetylglucosamine-6-phosphate deacetylase [Bacteroidales bacterium]